jgi:hypothetical protein
MDKLEDCINRLIEVKIMNANDVVMIYTILSEKKYEVQNGIYKHSDRTYDKQYRL